MNAIEIMQNKGINLFDTVTYTHNTGDYICVVTKIKSGGVVLHTTDNKDKPFLVYGNRLNNILKTS